MAFAKRKMPLVIGAEASGEVEAVGPGVAGLLPGQLVVDLRRAHLRALPRLPREAATISASTSPACTASTSTASRRRRSTCRRGCWSLPRPASTRSARRVAPVTFGTVEHMLFDNARLEPGETILVHAGGSGIGSAAIQLAKKIGCTVITTVGSDDKIDKAQGARRRPCHQLPRGPLRRRGAQADEEEGRRRRVRACRRRHLGRLDAVPEARRPARHLRLDLRRVDAR